MCKLQKTKKEIFKEINLNQIQIQAKNQRLRARFDGVLLRIS